MCSYGATASGKLVDAAGLQLLENMGFQRALAAEALKQVTSCFITPLLRLVHLWNSKGYGICSYLQAAAAEGSSSHLEQHSNDNFSLASAFFRLHSLCMMRHCRSQLSLTCLW